MKEFIIHACFEKTSKKFNVIDIKTFEKLSNDKKRRVTIYGVWTSPNTATLSCAVANLEHDTFTKSLGRKIAQGRFKKGVSFHVETVKPYDMLTIKQATGMHLLKY